MNKVIASAGLLALGAVGLQTARADMAPGSDKSWSISGTLRGFYDDNYNTVPSGPNRFSSWGFEFRPQGTYNYNVGPTSLSATYIYSLKDFTDRPGDQIDQAHEFDFTGNHAFNEIYAMDLEESFVSSQEPAVLNPNGGGGLLRANGNNYHNSVSLNFHDQFTKLVGVVVGYNNSWYDYTGGPATQGSGQPSYGTLLNNFVHTWSLDGRWTLSEETVAILEYKFQYTEYLSPASSSIYPATSPLGVPLPVVPAATRNSYSHIVDVGVEHSFRSDLGLNLHVGIQASEYPNYNNDPLAAGSGSNPDSITPYVDLSFNYNYMDGGVVTLGFRHSTTPTDVGYDANDNSLVVNEESSVLYLTAVQVLKPISPDLTGTFTFQYQDSSFDGGGLGNSGEDFYMLTFNLGYAFTKNFSADFGYEYDLLDSAVAQRGYDRSRVYLGVTATY